MSLKWLTISCLLYCLLFLTACSTNPSCALITCVGYPVSVCEKCGEDPVEVKLHKRLYASDLSQTQITASRDCVSVGFSDKEMNSNSVEVALKSCLSETRVLDEKTRNFLIQIVRDALNDKGGEPRQAWTKCYSDIVNDDYPSVLLMDSPIIGVVYNKDTQDAGGSNADDITNILKDLPVHIYKEATNRNWQRHEQVFNDIKPDLIILHLSAFYGVTKVDDPEKKLRNFILDTTQRTTAKILVYTRGPKDKSDKRLMKRWTEIKQFLTGQDYKDRVILYEFDLPYHKVDFRKDTTVVPFKRKAEKLIQQIEKEKS